MKINVSEAIIKKKPIGKLMVTLFGTNEKLKERYNNGDFNGLDMDLTIQIEGEDVDINAYFEYLKEGMNSWYGKAVVARKWIEEILGGIEKISFEDQLIIDRLTGTFRVGKIIYNALQKNLIKEKYRQCYRDK